MSPTLFCPSVLGSPGRVQADATARIPVPQAAMKVVEEAAPAADLQSQPCFGKGIKDSGQDSGPNNSAKSAPHHKLIEGVKDFVPE